MALSNNIEKFGAQIIYIYIYGERAIIVGQVMFDSKLDSF